ncbi:hypothetical protein AB8P51_00425 [Muriicola sp. SD30]|uniref:hypothetical protein n=1 Tax=Muriicola sp. SD30 TaxID=3240936 RepID=UPI00350EBA1F
MEKDYCLRQQAEGLGHASLLGHPFGRIPEHSEGINPVKRKFQMTNSKFQSWPQSKPEGLGHASLQDHLIGPFSECNEENNPVKGNSK